MNSKFSKSIIIFILSINILSCNKAVNLIPNNKISTFSNKFEVKKMSGLTFGYFEKSKLIYGDNIGKKDGYESESNSIKIVNSIQNKTFRKNNSYVIIKNISRYFIYEIKYSKNDSSLDSYDDLRMVNLVNSKNNIKILCLVSKRKSIRFFDKQVSGNSFNKNTNTIVSVLNRLRNMEKALGTKKDHRGIFSAMYRVITERGLKEINEYNKNGNQKSAKFVEKLILNFANKYFKAYDNYSNDNFNQIPEIWHTTFDSGRKSQNINLYKSGSIAEILALSMLSHIVHDLSFTLKEINYNPKDPLIEKTFFRFNDVLFEEKEQILKAIQNQYGNNIVSELNKIFGSVGDFTMQKAFSFMRKIASNQSQKSDKQQIEKFVINLADKISFTIPGGNSILNKESQNNGLNSLINE